MRNDRFGFLVCVVMCACGGSRLSADDDPGTDTTAMGETVAPSTSMDTTTTEPGESGRETTTGASTDEGTDTTGSSAPIDPGCPACIVLAWGLEDGRGVAVDTDHVYWTDQQAGTISRILKGGGNGTVIADGQSTPYAVAVDDTHVYWTNFTDAGAVMRVAKDGGSVELVEETVRPRAVAVDGAHVYWSTFEPDRGELWRRAKQLNEAPFRLQWFSRGIPDIAVGSTHVYLTTHTTTEGAFIEPPTPQGSVRAVAIDDGADAILVGNVAQPWGIALADGRLFWINGAGEIQPRRVTAVDTTGADVQVLASGQTDPWGITANATHVYWTDFTEVKALPREGGSTTVLADQQNGARTITHDDDSVYWITRERVLQHPKL